MKLIVIATISSISLASSAWAQYPGPGPGYPYAAPVTAMEPGINPYAVDSIETLYPQPQVIRRRIIVPQRPVIIETAPAVVVPQVVYRDRIIVRDRVVVKRKVVYKQVPIASPTTVNVNICQSTSSSDVCKSQKK